eukprot:COSAG02_NODE_10200_length_1996_cov_3.594623_1_plen_169_part_10
MPLSFSRTNTEKMTKPNYQYGKIYKIVNNVDDMIYIGSTCSRLSKRLHGHKIDKSGKGWKRRLYQHVDALGGWDHFRIILVQHHPCLGKDDLRMAEQRHIDATPPEKLLNMVRAYASVEDVIQRKAAEYQRISKILPGSAPKRAFSQPLEKKASKDTTQRPPRPCATSP